MPLGLGFAIAHTWASFFPHCEHRSRGARSTSIIDQPTRRASAWGSISRFEPTGMTPLQSLLGREAASLGALDGAFVRGRLPMLAQ